MWEEGVLALRCRRWGGTEVWVVGGIGTEVWEEGGGTVRRVKVALKQRFRIDLVIRYQWP